MSNIFYVGYYTTSENKEKRNFQPAARTKMEYVAEALHKIGYQVEIVSRSNTKLNTIFSGGIEMLSEGITLRQFRTIGGPNIIRRVLNRCIMDMSLFFYLLNKPSNSVFIVYHSVAYARMVLLLKRIKRFRLILEVEEIYADVVKDEKIRKLEWKLFKCADSYIFPTELLDEKINIQKKPSVIVHGTYQVQKIQVDKSDYYKEHHWDPNRIHLVYAGTLDPRKGGSAAAVAAAEYLNEKYHMHILGFGSEAEIKTLKDTIAKISAKTKCLVTYDGLLSGDQYLQFIQSCDIGLSTQDPKAKFNGTSFPSKILSYMANGLRVVSISIPAIRESAVGKYMYYYADQTPEEIAKAILNVKLNSNVDPREILSELDAKFCQDLKMFLE